MTPWYDSSKEEEQQRKESEPAAIVLRCLVCHYGCPETPYEEAVVDPSLGPRAAICILVHHESLVSEPLS
jgi:hypothetical protein